MLLLFRVWEVAYAGGHRALETLNMRANEGVLTYMLSLEGSVVWRHATGNPCSLPSGGIHGETHTARGDILGK